MPAPYLHLIHIVSTIVVIQRSLNPLDHILLRYGYKVSYGSVTSKLRQFLCSNYAEYS